MTDVESGVDMANFRFHIIEKIIDEVGSDDIDDSVLEVPPDPALGDYAFPCFTLSKTLKKSPQAIAEWLASKIKPDDVIAEVKNAGPYLNFFIDKSALARSVITAVLKDGGSFGQGSERRKVLLEFPSPNTNKPLHLGHIRNMLLGTSIGNILKFNGNSIINVNLNNDRGIHICKSMLAYRLFGDNQEPDMKSDHFVGKWYVIFAQKAKDQPELEEQAQEMLRKWEAGDKELHALWKRMNDWAFSGFSKTYETFGVTFDKQYFESEIFRTGKDYVAAGLKSGVFAKDDDGNVMVDLENYGLGKKVVLRADGTSVYATQDMALANVKNKDFPDADVSIYVVANEQDHYFRQLFKIFELMKYPFANRCYHLSYGMVNLPDGRMKSREGTVVDADDLVDEMVSLAKAAIELRHKELGDEKTTDRAFVIGMGALRFFILKHDPSKDMTYDPNESISFEGETGPYVQYVHARIAGIKKKYGKDLDRDIDFSLLDTPEEVALLKLIQSWPETA
ncbi:TPA: arginine--tRNA ligase, partial [Candidatus Woesearchaeota archaeon]|nr:arginine--tRNA ligase [Candidatus Woesearchaeota archaeon]